MTSTGSQTFISLPGAAGSDRRDNSGSVARCIARIRLPCVGAPSGCFVTEFAHPYQTCRRVEYDTSTDERGLLGSGRNRVDDVDIKRQVHRLCSLPSKFQRGLDDSLHADGHHGGAAGPSDLHPGPRSLLRTPRGVGRLFDSLKLWAWQLAPSWLPRCRGRWPDSGKQGRAPLLSGPTVPE